jgi:hypothetical protein
MTRRHRKKRRRLHQFVMLPLKYETPISNFPDSEATVLPQLTWLKNNASYIRIEQVEDPDLTCLRFWETVRPQSILEKD